MRSLDSRQYPHKDRNGIPALSIPLITVLKLNLRTSLSRYLLQYLPTRRPFNFTQEFAKLINFIRESCEKLAKIGAAAPVNESYDNLRRVREGASRTCCQINWMPSAGPPRAPPPLAARTTAKQTNNPLQLALPLRDELCSLLFLVHLWFFQRYFIFIRCSSAGRRARERRARAAGRGGSRGLSRLVQRSAGVSDARLYSRRL